MRIAMCLVVLFSIRSVLAVSIDGVPCESCNEPQQFTLLCAVTYVPTNGETTDQWNVLLITLLIIAAAMLMSAKLKDPQRR